MYSVCGPRITSYNVCYTKLLRLNLARVLMQTPDVLLLDEPGTGLDVASLALLRREITAARQRGACVVLISHDLAGDAPLADRLLALEHRKLAYDVV